MVSDLQSAKAGLHRARSSEDKQARRDTILTAAAAAFVAEPFDVITVESVARRAGLAKGTVYLYFASKEELFLALTWEAIAGWLDALDAALRDTRRGAAAGSLARRIVSTLEGRRQLLRLLGILHAVLERNVAARAIVTFKASVLQRLVGTSDHLRRVLPHLGPDAAVRLLLQMYAGVVGIWQMADVGPQVAAVLEAPELAPLRTDFERELTDLIAALVRGSRRA